MEDPTGGRTEVERLFLEALDRPAEDRAGFLDGACPDGAVRAQVESMLADEREGEAWFRRLAEGAGPFLSSVASESGGSAPGDEPAPERAGPYRIVRPLGRGGMGIVYLGHDPRLDRSVALKFLPPRLHLDPEAAERFREEARAASALDHPAIGTVYDIGETESGHRFIAMAYYPGETLRERLEKGAVGPGEALEIGREIAGGLGAAHAAGIVHRDIKPGNVILTEQGSVKIVDFGIAKMADSTLTRRGATVGTIAYMSPEQTHGGHVDARADVWSTGVVLYEMLTGRRPFRGESDRTLIHAIRHDDPPDLGTLSPASPAGLVSVIERCLRKGPAERYPDARSLADALAAPEPGGVGAPPAPRVRKLWAGVALAAIAIITLLLAARANDDPTPAGTPPASSVEARALSGPRVAVLPFEYVGTEPDGAYLTQGITEEVFQKLSRLRGLRLIGSTSTRRLEGATVPDLVAALDVDAIVTGSAREGGDRIRIAVRLLDAGSEEVLWSDEYDRASSDLFDLPVDIAGRIADELDLELERSRWSVANARAPHREAFLELLRARYYWDQRTPEMIERARVLLQETLDLDPTYAEAWATLAQVYNTMVGYDLLPPEAGYPRARAAAERALEIEPGLPEAHVALASLASEYEWDFDRARAHFARALDTAPGHALAHQWYSELLAYLGRPEQAAVEARRAQELDPLNLTAAANEGRAYYVARDYERALEVFDAVTARGPNFVALLYRALALALRSDHEAALEGFERFRAAFPGAFEHTLIALPYTRMGREEEARRVLREVERAAARGEVPAFLLATVYAAVGEVHAAFEWLDRAYEDHDWQMIFLAAEPTLDPLRSDPRFDALLERVGFPPEARAFSASRHAPADSGNYSGGGPTRP